MCRGITLLDYFSCPGRCGPWLVRNELWGFARTPGLRAGRIHRPCPGLIPGAAPTPMVRKRPSPTGPSPVPPPPAPVPPATSRPPTPYASPIGAWTSAPSTSSGSSPSAEPPSSNWPSAEPAWSGRNTPRIVSAVHRAAVQRRARRPQRSSPVVWGEPAAGPPGGVPACPPRPRLAVAAGAPPGNHQRRRPWAGAVRAGRSGTR